MSWAALGRVCQQAEAGDPSPYSALSEATAGVLCPVLGFLVEETRIYWRTSTERSTKMIKGLGFRDLIDVFTYQRGMFKQDRARIFLMVPRDSSAELSYYADVA